MVMALSPSSRNLKNTRNPKPFSRFEISFFLLNYGFLTKFFYRNGIVCWNSAKFVIWVVSG
jgi:hypothetical protein